MPTRRERIEGGLLGLLLGDALGVPYEFHSADALPRSEQIEFEPPVGFRRAHPSVRPGTWSDDGAQALCLLDSLLHRGRMDPEDFAQRLVQWHESGHLAVDGYVFDVGVQTARALRAIRGGVPVLEAAPRDPSANGNGALMRVLPLALWHRGTDEELARDARLSSIVTHGHVRSQLCCALLCLWVRRLLEDRDDAWPRAVASLRELVGGSEVELAELDVHIRPELEPERPGSGYVVDTLRSARMVLSRGTFEDVVKAAILLGDDTDTTAAVAGGVAGVRDGVAGLPERWKSALRGHELLDPLMTGLLAHVGA